MANKGRGCNNSLFTFNHTLPKNRECMKSLVPFEEIEKAAIHATLKSVSRNKTEAAKVLGIAYSTLYEKMKKHGMKE